jgi:N-acetylglucosamine-6-phosphate deacetylase
MIAAEAAQQGTSLACMLPGTDQMLIAAGRMVTPEWVGPGWLAVRDGRIAEVGPGMPPGPPTVDLGGYTVVPGFVDMHVHGGGGFGFSDADADAVRGAAAYHRRHGTTTTLASLVTTGPAELRRQVRLLAQLTEAGVIAGAHLEGPWLSAHRPGAHRRDLLRDPDPTELDQVLDAGSGTIRMVTIAPERVGGLDAIGRVVDAGALAAVGHTDADYATVRAAIDAGARVGTHLFNAMRPIHHREPGPVVALLEDPRVTVELILDGVHVHPALYRRVLSDVGEERIALVTDAMAASGRPDGHYRLGALAVTVASGVATLTGTDTIAGGTATMAELFGNAVRLSGLAEPAALSHAVALTATTPAATLSLADVGALRPGCRADLVALDRELRPAAVMRRGGWVVEAAG